MLVKRIFVQVSVLGIKKCNCDITYFFQDLFGFLWFVLWERLYWIERADSSQVVLESPWEMYFSQLSSVSSPY